MGQRVCVSVAHGRGGEPPPHGVAMEIISFFFSIKIASSSLDDFPLPWQFMTGSQNLFKSILCG